MRIRCSRAVWGAAAWLALSSSAPATRAAAEDDALFAFAERSAAEWEAEGFVPAFEGTLYELGSQRSRVLFHWRLWWTRDGERRRTRYSTPDGSSATSEELRLHDGSFAHYAIVHHGAEQRGSIRRIGGRLEFRYTKQGRTRTRFEEDEPSFVTGPMLVDRIQSHWSAIRRGEKLRVRLGVADRTETVGFEIFEARSDGNAKQAADGRVHVVMRPQSFLIRVLVDAVHFYFTPDGRDLLEARGRTIPLRRVGEDWEPVDADAVYRRIGPSQTRPTP